MIPYMIALLLMFSVVIPFLRKQEQKRLKERRERWDKIRKFDTDNIDDWDVIEPGSKIGEANAGLKEQDDENPFKPTM